MLRRSILKYFAQWTLWAHIQQFSVSLMHILNAYYAFFQYSMKNSNSLAAITSVLKFTQVKIKQNINLSSTDTYTRTHTHTINSTHAHKLSLPSIRQAMFAYDRQYFTTDLHTTHTHVFFFLYLFIFWFFWYDRNAKL